MLLLLFLLNDSPCLISSTTHQLGHTEGRGTVHRWVRTTQSGNPERRSAEDEEDDEREVEEFRILGHSMCLKRRRDSEPSSSSSSAAKRVSSEPNLEARRSAVRAWGNQSLCVADPDLYDMMESERKRQFKGLELIASENFVCRAVMEALGSHLTNKYSEGMAGARFHRHCLPSRRAAWNWHF